MLEVCNLKKSFNNKKVLEDVNFKLKPGEIVCLLGKNGSGKTTIINCILKMLKQDSGNIFLDGLNIDEYDSKRYFSNISSLLESSINVYNYLTAMENIEYFSGLLDINIDYDYINFLLDIFSLSEYKDKNVGTFSLGMRQKLAIIISLLSEPKVLLLDEPTLGLDIESKISIIKILKNLAINKNISILITTHQIDVVEKIKGRVILLKSGKIENFSLNKFKSKFLLKYKYNSEIITREVDSDLIDILTNIKLENLIEISKLDVNLEDIVMEKLNEFNKS